MLWKIATVNPDKTVSFAAEELIKYLKKIDKIIMVVLLY